jgi:hypothetical protein
MSNKGKDHARSDSLPGFLDGANAAAATETAVAATTAADAELLAAADMPRTDADADEAREQTPAAEDDAMADAVEQPPAPMAPQARSRRPAGGLSLLAGFVFAASGIALGFVPQLETTLSGYGLGPTTMLLVSGLLLTTGVVRRQIGAATSHIDAMLGEHEDVAAQLRSSIDYLVEQQRATLERPPAAGEELDRVFAAMQRQDEKINNLTKAVKMYGKPLMEISSQGTDAGATLTQLRTAQDGLVEMLKTGLGRVETGMRSIDTSAKAGGNKKELDELQTTVKRTEELLNRNFAALDSKIRNDGSQQQLTRVEAGVTALGQRLDDSEVRKSLLRLEDATKHALQKVEKLADSDSVHAGMEKLDKRVTDTFTKLQGGLEQLKTNNLGALEGTLKDIQREVASLATAVSRIQAAVKSGSHRAATPSEPTAAAPTPTPKSTEAPAAPSAATTPAADAGDAQAGVAQNQTGTRASSGRNVLGAIAKLKQMKH